MRMWRGNELPGGLCSKGSIAIGFGKRRAIVAAVDGARASTDRGDGSTAPSVPVPEDGCECIQQCPHGSVGRSKAVGSTDDSDSTTIVGLSRIGVSSAS